MTVRLGIFTSAFSIILLAGLTQNQILAQQPQAPRGVDQRQLVERLEAQDRRIRELEARLNQSERPIQMLPAVIETNNNVLNRLDALESAYSTSSAMNASAADAKLLGEDEENLEDTYEEKWTTKWGGRIMGDYVNWADQTPRVGGQDYFEFRRLRFFAEGEGYGVYDYKLQVDFEPENGFTVLTPDEPVDGIKIFTDAVALKDAYLGIHDIPILGYVRFGHFKAPFSLEELTSSKYITFMERGLPNVFAPSRKVGVAAFNYSDNERFTWAYGAFFDDISDVAKERVDDNQGIRVVGRATWTPYYDELTEGRYLIHTGLSAEYTDIRDDVAEFESRPEIHEGPYLVNSGAVDANDYTALDAEFAVVNGPLSLQSELMWVDVNADSGPNLSYYGAYAYVSYFLTGENRVYNRKFARFERVSPLESFWIVNTPDGRCCGHGAWELAARWSWLDLTNGPDDERLNDLTVGINWYWNSHARVMFNWIHPFTNGPSGDGNADILGTRMQVDF